MLRRLLSLALILSPFFSANAKIQIDPSQCSTELISAAQRYGIVKPVRALYLGVYQIVPEGMENIPPANGKLGRLFIANHSSMIGTVITGTTLAEMGIRVHPVMNRDQADTPLMKPFMNVLQPVKVPNVHEAGATAQALIDEGMEEILKMLRAGKDVLMYPSATLQRQNTETLAYKSMLEALLRAEPELQVSIVQENLFGDVTSHGHYPDGRNPSQVGVVKVFTASITNMLKGWRGRHRSPLRFVRFDRSELPENWTRNDLNRLVEAKMNEGIQENTIVPLFPWNKNWWSGPYVAANPEIKSASGHIDPTDPSIQKLIADVRERALKVLVQELGSDAKIEAATGGQPARLYFEAKGERNYIEDTARLEHIGLDSLDVTSVGMRIAEEFNVDPITEGGTIATVNDVYLAALGLLQVNEKDRTPKKWWEFFKKPQTPEQIAAKKKELLEKWVTSNRPKGQPLSVPEAKTVMEALYRAAERAPDEPMYQDERQRNVTPRQNVQRFLAMSWIFGKELKGQRVAVMMPTALAGAQAKFALLDADFDAIAIPNFTAGLPAVETMVNEENVDRIITSKEFIQGLDRAAGLKFPKEISDKFYFMEDLPAKVTWRIKAWAWYKSQNLGKLAERASRRIRAAVTVVGTSGTSDKSKNLAFSDEFLLGQVRQILGGSNMTTDDIGLAAAPTAHVVGHLLNEWLPFLAGLKTTFRPKLTESIKLAQAVETDRVTIGVLMPVHAQNMVRAARPGQLDTLRVMYTGAQALTADVVKDFAEKSPDTELAQSYGTTGVGVTHMGVPGHVWAYTSVGKALPGVIPVVADMEAFDGETLVGTLKRVPRGTTGVLLFEKTPQIIEKYRNIEEQPIFKVDGGIDGDRPGQVIEYFTDYDLVYEKEDEIGDIYMFIVDRLSRAYKIKGEWVNPGTLEKLLTAAFKDQVDISGPFVTVEPTADRGRNKRTVMVTSVEALADKAKANAVLRAANRPTHELIAEVLYVPELPLTGVGGKVVPRKVRALITETYPPIEEKPEDQK